MLISVLNIKLTCEAIKLNYKNTRTNRHSCLWGYQALYAGLN